MLEPQVSPRPGGFSVLPMPSTKRRSAAVSRARRRLGYHDIAAASQLALRLGGGSGKSLVFLLSTLQPRARSEYTRALQAFSSRVPRRWGFWSHERRDFWLSEYILEQLDDTGVAGPARVLCAALQKVGICRLKRSWKILDGWSKLHPAVQAPAMPRAVLHAYVFSLMALGEPYVAMLLMTCFYGVMRISEALGLKVANIFYGRRAVTFYLGTTKRGEEEVVVVENRTYLRWFRAFQKRFPTKGRSNIWLPCSYARVSRWLERLGHFFGLDALGFTSHSLRRGGATQLLINRMSVEQIMLFGRWAKLNSCKEYLRKGQVFLMRVHTLAKSARWELIDLFAKNSVQAWRMMPSSSG